MRKDWVLGILITLAVLGAFALELYPLQALEYVAYDFMSAFRHKKTSDNVAIVAVDEKSLRSMGGRYLPRASVADMVGRLDRYGARVIGVDFLYSGPEHNPGLDEVKNISEDLKKQKSATAKKIYRSVKKARWEIDGDARLAYAAKSSGAVVLPVLFTPGEPKGDNKAGKLAGALKKNTVAFKEPPGGLRGFKNDLFALKNPFHSLLNRSPRAVDAAHPHDRLASTVRALGHINHTPDRDGTVRRDPLLVYYMKRHALSFALQVGLGYYKKDESDLAGMGKTRGVECLQFTGMKIPAGKDYKKLISFSAREAVSVHSFADVMEGKVPSAKFKNKAVLIGHTGPGAPVYDTPVGRLSEVELSAVIAENIINNNHIARPNWAFALEVAVILYFGLFATFILPKVKPMVGALLILLSLLPLAVLAVFLFFYFGYWLMLFSPSALLILGLAATFFREYVMFGKRSASEAENAEGNRMLGLTFQGQGMLDMAFEKFMKLPLLDRGVKELLYNLALDFERKRMHAKAKAVHEHILKAGNFRDVRERIKKLDASGETGVFGAGARKDATVRLTGAGAKPTLGRYEVVKELGRGAMGTVYLGRDPKINREVAIKTLVYDEVEPEQLKEVKKRFFQEAEAAGRLSHPNIMTIYDAGEEHDMAYLAMELLSGKDLSAHCTKKSLLPHQEVMRVVGDVAGALEYAHKKGVVHRDIKPANIMLLADGAVKVTDFGIARVVESSKTHTGTILGTPSYMSPEQVAGEKVEGPSDLFSLGAVFYELLSGEKAFKGDSIAAIMYNISVCEFVPLGKVARKVPGCCDSIVTKLLARTVTRRYKSGEDVVNDIAACMAGKGR